MNLQVQRTSTGDLRRFTRFPLANQPHAGHGTWPQLRRCNVSLKPQSGLHWRVRAEEDGPQFAEMDESSTRGLGGTSARVFGPPAILAVGCTDVEQDFLRDVVFEVVEGEPIQVVPATEAMLNSTLSQAFQMGLLSLQKSPRPLGIRRTVFFSGMYTHEVMEVIRAYREQGLPRAVFAAAVPNNWNSNLRELVDEVYDDDRRMHQQ